MCAVIHSVRKSVVVHNMSIAMPTLHVQDKRASAKRSIVRHAHAQQIKIVVRTMFVFPVVAAQHAPALIKAVVRPIPWSVFPAIVCHRIHAVRATRVRWAWHATPT